MQCSRRHSGGFASVWLLVAFMASSAVAGTIHVPMDEPTIQAGIDAAAQGDTVCVASGVYYEHDIRLGPEVHLTSVTGTADCAVIDALGLGRVLVLEAVGDDVSIRGFTLTGGDAGEYKGGAMFCSASSSRVEACEFVANRAEWGGAVIGRDGAALTFVGCAFRANEADMYGGAVCVWGGYAQLDGCLFEGNCILPGWPSATGGGLYATECELDLLNCVFERNEAAVGGAAGFHVCSGEVTGCVFRENVALSWAGALSLSWSTPPVSDCEFVDNSAGAGAGALSFYGHAGFASQLTRCSFVGNSADLWGAVHGGSVDNATFLECTFVGNSSADNIGAVALLGTGSGGADENTFIDCEFRDNSTRLDCGALYLAECQAVITGCTFSGNSAGRNGGALVCRNWSTVDIDHCTMYANTAGQDGAAIYSRLDVEIHLTSSIVAFCTGENTVHCVDGGVVLAECCDVFGNSTGTDWSGCLAGQQGTAHNIRANPMFCLDSNPGAPLTLKATSPCLIPECGGPTPIGAWGVGCDVSPVERISWGLLKARYR